MIKAYISSTYKDLVDYRDAVIRALRKAQVEVVGMEDYASGDCRPLDRCRQDVAQADIYIAILAHRYGYVPDGNNPLSRSITDLEYRHALEKNKPCLIFLHQEEDAWPLNMTDAYLGDYEAAKRLRELRTELAENHLTSFFTTPDNLSSLVVSSVRDEQQRWVPNPRDEGKPFELALPDVARLRLLVKQKDSNVRQLNDVFNKIANLFELTLELFVVSVVRSYEDVIVDEPPEFLKKVRPIKRLISEHFIHPTLATVRELAHHCAHLVNESAPDEVRGMKERLTQDFLLGPTGDLLDELEALFPPDVHKPRLMAKAKVNRNLLDFVIPEIGKYLPKIAALLKEPTPPSRLTPSAIEASLLALEALVAEVRPVFSQVFVLDSLEETLDSGKYKVSVHTYQAGKVALKYKEVSFEDLEDYESGVPQLLVSKAGETFSLRLSPFLILKNNCLYFYKHTRASGYEYHSLCDPRPQIEKTRRKFSHSAFKVGLKGTQQALFWAEAIRTKNEENGVSSNIPSEGKIDFIGRRKQKKQIREEIVEISNRDGLVFGVGGVGKTALMIELSRELANSPDPVFNNVIWVSAKSTYYNPILNVTEKRERQADSLEKVISSMLVFFELEELEGYTLKDKKELLTQLLMENTAILILDNFETLASAEKDAIIAFFGTELKRKLAWHPKNFKIIITSREARPSGFHPIPLGGLDVKEANQLMDSLYTTYKTSGPELSQEQKDKVYKATAGIPIIIKHCFGQIYEHRRPFETVVDRLPKSDDSEKLVKFSFTEILSLVRKDQSALQVLLLLEQINCPLMIRQIADILGQDESLLQKNLPILENYQCVRRSNEGPDEKYDINPEIRLLTRKLLLNRPKAAAAIRQAITKKFTIEKQMDYTERELEAVTIFDDYIHNKQFLEAEQFIKTELEKHPQSILLNFRFAKHLQEERSQLERAIDILERIREAARNHASILRLLVACYTALDIPCYSKAAVYVHQLETLADKDESLILLIGEFYARWSAYTRNNKPLSPDPNKELVRKQECKEQAEEGVAWLKKLQNKNHYMSFLLAECYFSLREFRTALRMIQEAVSSCKKEEASRPEYLRLKRALEQKQERFDQGRFGQFASAGSHF